MTLQEPFFTDITTPSGPMRVHRFAPLGPFSAHSIPAPAVVLYSEIYQVTGPIRRLAARLAGEGFEVLVPEVYHEYEAPGTVLTYDTIGTDRGNFLKHEKPIEQFDSDVAALINWIFSTDFYSSKDGNKLYPWLSVGALGFCLGGHLAFRAALDSRVAAAACFYPTDIHSHALGKGKHDDTLRRVQEIRAELLLIWGRQDPHVPAAGRRAIYEALQAAERHFQWLEVNGAHAFVRDEGYRYDAALSRLTWESVLELFNRTLRFPRAH